MLELQRSRNWEQFILARQIVREPGATFDYNSGNAHLLSIALMRRTDCRPTRTRASTSSSPGHFGRPLAQGSAGSGHRPLGLYMNTRDMARIGQLYLQRGVWNGRQVVPRTGRSACSPPGRT